MQRRALLGSLATLGLLGGCGFRLRGHLEVPPGYRPILIEAPSHSSVAAIIRDRLLSSGIEVTGDPQAARLRLILYTEQRDARVAAVDLKGKTLAWDLHYLVDFAAVDAGGETHLPRQTLDLSRIFDNPDIEVLGKQIEQEQIYADLAAESADRILMRLRAVLR
ncbi:LPS assembly lipoprotein LptE [Caldichromatium japonicum]|nr:LPS assembly lipoprotein LptE [Caldichromatium japonicum]